MSDTAQLVNTLVGLALMSVLDLVYWLSIEGSHKRLDDPEDDRTLWLDQLPDKIALAPSFYGSSARLSLGRLAVASLLPSQASNTVASCKDPQTVTRSRFATAQKRTFIKAVGYVRDWAGG